MGFEPTVELITPQPLSRRPQSSTLAPPRIVADYSQHVSDSELRMIVCSGGGRGIRTPGDLAASAVFKTAAIVHSAIPPIQYPAHAAHGCLRILDGERGYPLSVGCNHSIAKWNRIVN